MIRLPDLLHLEPRLSVDRENLSEILDLAFLGKEGLREVATTSTRKAHHARSLLIDIPSFAPDFEASNARS